MSNVTHPSAFAAAYFIGQRIPCKIYGSYVECWGCVKVLVRYSTTRLYNPYYRWSLPRPIVADVVLLIASDGALEFYLFDPDDNAFYYADGRQKQNVTWNSARAVQLKHEERFEALTNDVMSAARDRLELIEAARLEHAEA